MNHSLTYQIIADKRMFPSFLLNPTAGYAGATSHRDVSQHFPTGRTEALPGPIQSGSYCSWGRPILALFLTSYKC